MDFSAPWDSVRWRLEEWIARFACAPGGKATLLAGIATPLMGLAAVVASGSPASPGNPAAAITNAAQQPAAPSPEMQAALMEAFAKGPAPGGLVAKPIPFFFHGNQSEKERALDCLSAAAWYEAGDDREGQRSVVQVVLNRVRHHSFPNSVCGVVFQGSERKTGCQFTFTCDGSLTRRPSATAWARARGVAQAALDGAIDTAVQQATHYHADYVTPWWSSKLVRLSTVGAHIFYRWPGATGVLNSATKAGGASEFSVASLGGLGGAQLPGAAGPADTPEAAIEHMEQQPALIIQPEIGKARPATMTVSMTDASGRWAMDALNRCRGKADCQVLAYFAEEAGDLDAAPPTGHDRPAFLFIRDGSSGMELALWDCDKVKRSTQSQCLPRDQAAITRLIEGRRPAPKFRGRIAGQLSSGVSERP